MNKFTHLHSHTHYSLLDGLSNPSRLITQVKELGMDSIAITDHGNMYGAIEFYKECKKQGIKPIIGCEVYFVNDMSLRSLYLDPDTVGKKLLKIDKREKDNDICHLTILAMNNTGYHNLIKLVSEANLKGFYYKPRIDFNLLSRYSEGLICLSGCLGGQLSQLILAGKTKEAEEHIKKFVKLFGNEYYIEVQRHEGIPEQGQVTEELYRLADKFCIGTVATTDCHYIHKSDAEIHDILLAVQTKKKVNDPDRMSMIKDDFSLASYEDMITKFADHPESVENSNVVADRCNIEIELGKYNLPHFKIPEGETPDSYLGILCGDGMVKRGLATLEYGKRLEYELDVIEKTGFASYLLIVADIINWAKNQGIAVGPGRGSSAGSLICYFLGITNVDPIKYGLYFERFMNPDRISPPDIDCDFEDARRDEVINYMAGKYGEDHVAQIITFGSIFARMGIKDVGRALGIDIDTCDRISKLIPFKKTIADVLKESKEMQGYYREHKKMIDAAMALEGTVRHASTHACGVLIADKPITDYMPVQIKDNKITTQYDMNCVDDLGLLKIDILGLRNLTVISETVRLVEDKYKKKIDIHNLPLNDKRTFKLFQEGKTTSVFQFESRGMKNYLKQLKPTSIDDITAMVSLYRPGPMELVPEYIARKHGRTVTYLHPSLRPVLENTYGIMIYQEQLMGACRALAGFTLAEADILRKATGKKIKELLYQQESKFKIGCANKGVHSTIADKFWKLIEPFHNYSFNKSHAVAYAMIAYQTAYLKANFPIEFMTSELNSNTDIERITELMTELKDMGIRVLPPDISISRDKFLGKNNTILFSLSSIKGLGEKMMTKIVEKGSESFNTIQDFALNFDGNKKVIEILAKAGALDRLGRRSEIIAASDMISVYSKIDNKDLAPIFVLPDIEEISDTQKRKYHKELLGISS